MIQTHLIHAVQELPRIKIGRVHHYNRCGSYRRIYAHLAVEAAAVAFLEEVSLAIYLADVPTECHLNRLARAVGLWSLYQAFCLSAKKVRTGPQLIL